MSPGEARGAPSSRSSAASGSNAGSAADAGIVEVIVLGSGPAAPQRDSSGSGVLVSAGDDRVLVDCGPGVATQLRRLMDPRSLGAVVVTHFHADHFLDLVPLRYAFDWPGVSEGRLLVVVPPGGAERLEALARAVSERPSFFSDAFDIAELDPASLLCVGSLRLAFTPARHYVPAWSVEIVAASGVRILYTGDTGPSERLLALATDADLLISEATLARPDEDDEERGHLTLDEAIELALVARPRLAMLVHLPSDRRREVARRAARLPMPLIAARPGTRLAIEPRGQ